MRKLIAAAAAVTIYIICSTWRKVTLHITYIEMKVTIVLICSYCVELLDAAGQLGAVMLREASGLTERLEK